MGRSWRIDFPGAEASRSATESDTNRDGRIFFEKILDERKDLSLSGAIVEGCEPANDTIESGEL